VPRRGRHKPMTDQADLVRCLTAPNPSPLTGTGTNTYLVGSGDIAVIDPGPDLDHHLEAILANLRPKERIGQIIVTHAHRDHSALAARLAAQTGASVLAFGDAFAGRSPGMAVRAARLGPAGEGLDLDFQPDQRLFDKDRIAGPDWELVVHHTPGHLGGHLCLALGQTLFSGDHVMGWSTSVVAPPDGDMGDYMGSLHRLAQGEWRRCLPGHGPAVEDPLARIDWLIRHRQSREAAILKELSQGPSTIPVLAQRLYLGIAPSLLGAAELNILAHLIDLLDRNLVSAQPWPDLTAIYARL